MDIFDKEIDKLQCIYKNLFKRDLIIDTELVNNRKTIRKCAEDFIFFIEQDDDNIKGIVCKAFLSKVKKAVVKCGLLDGVLKCIERKMHHSCEVCRTALLLKKCGKCQRIYYCSVECQKKDYIKHKNICKEYSK